MNRFFQSLVPIKSTIKKKLKKYKIEVVLLVFALLSALISVGIYFAGKKDSKEAAVIFEEKTADYPSKIFIDIAGAVEKPDVYEVTVGARLKDFLIMAGGLSAEADREFFSRNFNLARIVADQEKIYIPSVNEVQRGFFVENQQTLKNISENQSEKININTATIEELDELPGVGKVTAKKIIEGRPYENIDQLLTKKVVNKSVYEKIKELIITD